MRKFLVVLVAFIAYIGALAVRLAVQLQRATVRTVGEDLFRRRVSVDTYLYR